MDDPMNRISYVWMYALCVANFGENQIRLPAMSVLHHIEMYFIHVLRLFSDQACLMHAKTNLISIVNFRSQILHSILCIPFFTAISILSANFV